MSHAQGISIGGLQIDVVPEVRYRLMPKAFLFADLTHADQQRNAHWLGSRYIHPETLALGIAFQAYVIRAHGQVILVDTCNGMHKQRPAARWAHDLRSANFMTSLNNLGLRPEDVDIVMCTHLHTDHVGWNTRLVDGRWVPTFPNARYVMNRAEYDHWAGLLAQTKDPAAVATGSFSDSVLPVVEAGQADFVDDRAEIGEGIFLHPSPGHSPGHVCVNARFKGAEAMIAGDLLHHPVQFDMPDLTMRADFDPALAVQSRRSVLEYCAGSGAHFCAGHIPDWSFGHVHEHSGSDGGAGCTSGPRFRLRPVAA